MDKREKRTWGWLGYRRIGWIHEDGHKLYEARMCTCEGKKSVVECAFLGKASC